MVPFNLVVRAQQPFVAGLGRGRTARQVYVTRGAGLLGAAGPGRGAARNHPFGDPKLEITETLNTGD